MPTHICPTCAWHRQAYVVENTEIENRRFNIDAGLLVLERETEYRAGQVSAPGLHR